MAEMMAGKGGLVRQPPRRPSRYDSWLDGRMWRVKHGDIPHLSWPTHAVRALRDRARKRGLRLFTQRLDDGSVVVQASERGYGTAHLDRGPHLWRKVSHEG